MNITVPVMEEDVPDAEIVEVSVSTGDRVTEGQVLFIIAFDKADVEIPSPTAGVVAELLTSEGELVDPGQVLARITPGTV